MKTTPWRLHDLRRCFSTNLNKLGIQPHVVEGCLNHVSGFKASRGGRFTIVWHYLPEKKAALESLGRTYRRSDRRPSRQSCFDEKGAGGKVNTIDADIVRRAVRVIGPAPKHHIECEAMVRTAIAQISTAIDTVKWVSPSKPKRKAAGRLHQVLRRLQAVLKDTNLDQDLRLLSPEKFDDWLKQTKAAQGETGKTIQLNARRKMIAANEAINLLEHFGKEISAKKRSKLCRLAAVLYGHPNVDLQYQCRIALRSELEIQNGSRQDGA